MAMTDATATTYIQRSADRTRSTQRADLLAPIVLSDVREEFRYVVRLGERDQQGEPLG